MPSNLRATYRLQLNPGFTLDDAAALADYLSGLGVSHMYCSPYLQAAPGSMHGYDVIDPQRVNAELGGAPAHARLLEALERHSLGQVLDIVPNHMAIVTENPWWRDVLEHGPASRYAFYFDVDWDPPEARHSNAVLVPVLGDHYGRVLEAGELRLAFEGEDFSVHYHEHNFPVDPYSYAGILGSAAERSRSDELAFLAEAFGRLPQSTATDRASARRRHRDQAVLRSLLSRMVEQNPKVRAAIEEIVWEINADPDKLDDLLEAQNYRLVFWRLTRRELGYRRFFDINTLIGLRTEDQAVYEDTHALITGWLRSGTLDGVRIDHPDGLRDPEEYFQRLRQDAPEAWIVIEKILERGEQLPASWPVAGTTGYDFLNELNGLFVHPGGEAPLTELYARFTGQSTDYPALVRAKKLLVLDDLLGSDVNRLTALFLQVCERNRRYRDYTRNELRDAITELAADLPVYRTYVRAEEGQLHATDVQYIDQAVDAAKNQRPDLDPELLDFLRDLLLLRVRGTLEAELVMRFQQLTGPAMAKGVEDTAFYVFNRLVSLNEVGGDPGHFGFPAEDFHRACQKRAERWPQGMLATGTHDAKRSEDVRARLNVLSEIPQEWAQAVERWCSMNERHRLDQMPDRNVEYLLYQTLVGAWPIELERVLAYMEKAAREAKVYTSWRNPEAEYEAALAGFTRGVMLDETFTSDLEAFVDRVRETGWINSLAQTLIKLTCPGVPDLYQGTELWSFSLVDPDNRRPVDYEQRRQLLSELEAGMSPEDIWARAEEGLPKLWVVRQALALRSRRPEWFDPESSYRPLSVQRPGGEAGSAAAGAASVGALAFVRGEGVVTVVPRFTACREAGWEDASIDLPPGVWRNELTGERLEGGTARLESLLACFPVCLLSKEGSA